MNRVAVAKELIRLASVLTATENITVSDLKKGARVILSDGTTLLVGKRVENVDEGTSIEMIDSRTKESFLVDLKKATAFL